MNSNRNILQTNSAFRRKNLLSVMKPGSQIPLLLGLSMLLLSGCGSGILAPVTRVEGSGAGIRGTIFGGQQPVTGAAVYLYAAGTGGYGTAATSLLSSTLSATNNGTSNVSVDGNNNGFVTTNSAGYFNISGDYSCSTGQMVYLLALGGNPGNSSGNANTNIALMAALGSCSFLQTNAGTINVSINELTTVAAAYALSPFMTSATNLATSSGNATGLANAFGMVNNLVNFSTGTAPGSGAPVAGGTFAGLPAGLTIPTTTIGSLGNILANCVNSDPTAGSTNCSTLFGLSKSTAGVTPTDTVQAILNIAKNPGANVAALYTSSSSYPQFATALGTQPNDWSLLIKVNGGGLNYPNQLAVDSQGNVWAANTGGAAITKLSPTGSRLSGTSGFTGTGITQAFGVAVDGSDNAWFTNTGSSAGGIIELSSSGTVSGPFTGGGLTTASVPAGIAIDASGNVWAATYTTGASGAQSINEFSSSGTLSTGPIDVSGVSTSSKPYGIAFDASGYLWVANRAAGIARLSSTGTAVTGSPYSPTGTSNAFHMAFDSSGNAWIANFGSNEVTKVNSTGTVQTGSPFTGSGQISEPAFIAIDGLNTTWVANYGTTTTNGCITQLSNAGAALSGVCLGIGSLTNPHGLAIDGSGNLWIGEGNTFLHIMVGVAAPVITPLVTATKNSQLGVRP